MKWSKYVFGGRGTWKIGKKNIHCLCLELEGDKMERKTLLINTPIKARLRGWSCLVGGFLITLELGFLSVAYHMTANLARLGILVYC